MMDESTFWRAFERGTGIAVAANVARACFIAIQSLAGEVQRELLALQENLRALRENPGTSGVAWTRSQLAAEIASAERAERRFQVQLAALRQHAAQHEAELARLEPMRESTARVLNQMIADFEAKTGDAADAR